MIPSSETDSPGGSEPDVTEKRAHAKSSPRPPPARGRCIGSEWGWATVPGGQVAGFSPEQPILTSSKFSAPAPGWRIAPAAQTYGTVRIHRRRRLKLPFGDY